jgi:hypothetical protein
VPHGDPAAVLTSLTEYYGTRYLAGYPDALGSARPDRPVGLPALVVSPAERERLLGMARDRAAMVARDLFERRVCVDCHTVTQQTGAAAGWRVEPVRLTSEWMPKARFDHGKHGTELTPCTTCHAATTSREASDVLMPAIGECRDCHGGEARAANDRALLPSTCTMCHTFHNDAAPQWPNNELAMRQWRRSQ